MRQADSEKIVLVTRPTRMAGLKRRFSTKMQAEFYLSRMRADFSDYENEDQQYATSIAQAIEMLSQFRRVQSVDRSYLPNFIFAPSDIVVTLGQDGLVANTLKYLDGQPLIGVNPDPKRWDGVLLPFQLQDLPKIVPEVAARRRKLKNVTMAEATLSTKQSLFAVNDFFIGAKSHISARYQIRVGNLQETHSSSGVIVSTGLGSTGWLKSVVQGARQIALQASALPSAPQEGSLPGFPSPPTSKNKGNPSPFQPMKWDDTYLTFSVREPFPSRNTQAGLVFGQVDQKRPLVLSSLMPENGVIFSDGIEEDFVEFSSGTEAVIAPAKRVGHLVV